MNFFEEALLNLGFSWTLSKVLPYLLFTLLTLSIGWFFFKKKKHSFLFKLFILLVSSSIGFFAYFIYAPIYEGDFSNNGVGISAPKELNALKSSELFVITIPGCPFCAESIGRMKEIKRHNPSIKITYLVCSSNSENLIDYKKLIGDDFKVRLADNPKGLSKVSHGSFPSFLLIDRDGATHWSNQDFGVRAVDFVNNKF